MGYGTVPNSNHFTGKKKYIKNTSKRVIRKPKNVHINKYLKKGKWLIERVTNF